MVNSKCERVRDCTRIVLVNVKVSMIVPVIVR